MTKITASLIRKVREESGAPVMRVKKVLDEVIGGLPEAGSKELEAGEKKAIEILKKEGYEKAKKRSGRETGQGLVACYVHHNGKVGVILSLLTETDFVAKNELFGSLARELAMQVASMDPADKEELLGQDFIKDTSRKIRDLIAQASARTGENIRIGRFTRIEI